MFLLCDAPHTADQCPVGKITRSLFVALQNTAKYCQTVFIKHTKHKLTLSLVL